MKKLFDGVLMGLGIVLVLVIFVIGFLKVQARLPDADGLTAENGDKLTVSKINSLIPESTVVAFYATSCPTGRKPANGNSGTPDLRGRFIRGLNSFEGGSNLTTAANGDPDCTSRTGGCVIGSFQADEFKSHNHTLIYQRNFNGGTVQAGRASNNRDGLSTGSPHFKEVANDMPYRGGNESRGKNVALIFCMKK